MKISAGGTVLLLVAVAAASTPVAEQRYLRYERAVKVAPTGAEACAVLDATTFAHAGPSLRDVRLYQGAVEVPYAVTLSDAATIEDDNAKVMNLGTEGGRIVFDLQMPAHPYTDVVLQVDARNFMGSVEVWGRSAPHAGGVRLGEFAIFDLTGQKLSRSTVLHLQESNFRYLHVSIASQGAGGVEPLSGTELRGAVVPPSRQAQTVYTTAVETTSIAQRGHETVAVLELAPGIPVERIAFELDPNFKGNFKRDVRVTAKPKNTGAADIETVRGEISRIHMTLGRDLPRLGFANEGTTIDDVRLEMPATLGANLHGDAMVEIAIENGDDTPLPLKAVRLEMRERRLCFDAVRAPSPVMYYGDAMLPATVYDFAKLLPPGNNIAPAQLADELPNPGFTERPDSRPFTERHPELLWVVLLAAIAVLGVVALRSARRLR